MNARFGFVLYLLCSMTLSVSAQLLPVKQWVFVYDGPGHGVDLPADAMIDSHGSLYMTGRSDGVGSGQDITTVRISFSGQESLVLRYNSVYDSWDEGNSLAVDGDGNIFVAGTSFVTSSRTEIVLFKYSPSGSALWQSHFSLDTIKSATARTVRLDPFGNAYVGGSTGGRFLVLKYDPLGNLVNTATFGDDSTSHELSSFVIGANHDRLYLTGARSYWNGGDLPTAELAVIATDTQCTLLWKNYLEAEAASALKLDADGNLVIITHGDGTTAKYSPDGQLLWFKNSQNSDTTIFVLTGLAIDSQNRIIVSGYDCDTGCFDYAVMKYDPAGNVLWRRSYNSPDSLRDFSMNVAVDRHDAVYLTGSSQKPDYSNTKCLTVKFDSSGTFMWQTTFSSGSLSNDIGEFIFVTDSGDVYVGGSSATSTGWDYLVIKYRQDSETGIAGPRTNIPLKYSLAQNFPNPFNPTTTISYSIPEEQFVSLRVHDLLGKEVLILISEYQRAGTYSLQFEAGNLSTGVYFYRLSAGAFTQTKRLVVIK